MWSSDAPRRPRRRLVNVKGPSKFRTASSAVDRPRLRYRCDAAAFHAWTPGLLPNDGMQYWMQYVCTRLLPFLRRAAATTPFPDTRQRRGAAPETALSSAVSSQAQRHQVWCKTPRATGSPPPTPPTLMTIRADVREEAKNRAGWQKTGAHHMINSLGALPPPPKTTQKCPPAAATPTAPGSPGATGSSPSTRARASAPSRSRR